MPATWTVITVLALNFNVNPFILALVGAVAATVGRIILAKLSRNFIRPYLLSPKTKKNIDTIKTFIERRKKTAFAIFLTYSFSPLPSNQLFIAYGLTRGDLKILVVPFFIGRIVSYGFWAYVALHAKANFIPTTFQIGSTFGGYFLFIQVLTVLGVYIFTKIPWKRILAD